MLSRQLALFGALSVLAVACGGGSSKGGAGASGSTGTNNGGTTGSAGGTTGDNGGATGSTGGTTGSAGGTTGSNGGTTGSTGGTTGSTGGTTGSAGGTTGSNGGTTGSAGGTTGSTGGTTGAGGQFGPTDGCDQPPPATEPIGKIFRHDITVAGLAAQYSAWTQRSYCTIIPNGYTPDPKKPYPLLVYGPGCGATSCEGVGLFTGHTDGMMVVQAIASSTAKNPDGSSQCFQTGKLSTVDSPELNYFDQIISEVSAKYCVDKGRIFVAGTSSGSWFSNYLGCARGNVIRAISPDSGGIPFAHPPCTGGAAAFQFPGNEATDTDSMGHPIGMTVARDLFIMANGTAMTPTQMTFGSITCDYYSGVSPVVYCPVCGSHQCGQQYFAPDVLPWWMSLPPK